ncbi:hypothetical protein SJI19_00500 [Acerihabitans sp. TG2]|uniref:hypothetical protein n=1 Tax=Acerihabitans sp. TG2 TaxID=3096008 RepID=UPI002B222132|nr:hypothetical protein [Acerihabitans sp. TG2]MEA9389048.1 hypothetical protein [Acerihabitans sp. TG2]
MCCRTDPLTQLGQDVFDLHPPPFRPEERLPVATYIAGVNPSKSVATTTTTTTSSQTTAKE